MEKHDDGRSKLDRSIVLASTLIGICVAVGGVHHLSAQTRRADLDGVYVLRKSVEASEEAARNASIRSVTDALEPHEQKRWRAILEISTRPEQRLSVATTSNEVAVTKGDRAEVKTPLTGATRTLSGSHTVSQRLEGRNLVQTITSPRLSGLALTASLEQSSHYRMGADEQTLEVETTIRGGALKSPIVFRATYDRR